MNQELINKITDNIAKLQIIKQILIKAPQLNLDAKIVVKGVTNIDIEELEKRLY